MRAIRSLSLKLVMLLSVGVLFAPCSQVSCRAANNEEPTAPQLLKDGRVAMASKRYDMAANYFEQYLDLVSTTKNPRVLAIMQDIRYKLASIYMGKKGGAEYRRAIPPLEAYSNYYYGNKHREVLKLLANCQSEVGKKDKTKSADCIVTVKRAIALNEDYNAAIAALKEANDAQMDDEVSRSFVPLEKLELEDDYTEADIQALTLLMAEAYYALGQWSECIEPFTYVSDHTSNQSRKGYTIMQIINALLEMKEFERVSVWIPQLYRTDARFDIRVNLALMNAASKMYEEGLYNDALPLYRMILPRDVIINHYSQRLRDLRVRDGLPPEAGMALTEAELALFGAEATEADDEDDAYKSPELLELEALMDALNKLPPYEDNIAYRMADIYKQDDVRRYWEAITFYDKVFQNGPGGELGRYAIYEIVDTLMNQLRETKDAEVRGRAYLDEYNDGITPRQIAYILNSEYQKHKDLDSIKSLLPYLDGFERTNDTDIIRFDSQLYFMQAVADLMKLDYPAAEAGFKRVMDEFPGSTPVPNAHYWWGMSKLFQQDYAGGLDAFDEYTKKYSGGDYAGEAYYQSGVCLFGLEKYDEAMARFTYVIDKYRDCSTYPEANNMRGDIYGSRGGDDLDKAIADYQRAYHAAKKAQQATYATFQMTAIFEAEHHYDEILNVVTAYKDEWGDKEGADIAKALLWIGKTFIQKGKPEEAIRMYVDAIVEYGEDVKQDGVDMMIGELNKIAAIWLDDPGKDALRAEVDLLRVQTKSPVLELRLRVLLAKMDHTEVELGKTLLGELDDLRYASPPVLAVMCDASFELETFDKAEEILRLFSQKFDDSDYMRAAFKLRAKGQMVEGDNEGALATVIEAQEYYGTEYDVAWAQLMKAQLLLLTGKYEEAFTANMEVFNVPEWRGAPVAQATYQLGQVEDAKGNTLKAFGYYQRTYFQYKGLAKGYWAAEAYLASARCLRELGRENDRRNTYRAMLFDRYVNTLPQAEVARMALGAEEVQEIEDYMNAGNTTNITITVKTEEVE